MYRREKRMWQIRPGQEIRLNGAFALQRAKGADMETALRYANVAASLSTEKFGAQSGMPMAQEVEEELKNWEEEHETTGDFKQ